MSTDLPAPASESLAPVALAITTSVFDLFKVGPGPSSSHTIGPMRAAHDFLQRAQDLPDADRARTVAVQVHLFGSLSATGRGHGTDRAVVAGLLGWLPDTCHPARFAAVLKNPAQRYPLAWAGPPVTVGTADFVFHKGRPDLPHPNTLRLQLLDEREGILLEHEYYSLGGGFIQRRGEAPTTQSATALPYPYASMRELRAQLGHHGITLVQLMLANETALTGTSVADINRRLDRILGFMSQAVRRGLRHVGTLPGTLRLRRKAPNLYQQAKAHAVASDAFLIFLNAYCLAASEENAAGSIVVTAPTSGASGVIPGVTYLLKHHYHYTARQLREGLLAAAAVGFLVKHNASISGAEMGCMGEVGTAAAMAAALLTYCATGSVPAVEAAAEIAIEHHLGMTCDPIGGYVQIPCIERNAMGAVKAYNAYLLATTGDPAAQKISLDSVIKVMKATGRDMSKKYKETSEAGLALSATEC